MRCPACGLYQPIKFEFCLNCGYDLASPADQKRKVSAVAKGQTEQNRNQDKPVDSDDQQAYLAGDTSHRQSGRSKEPKGKKARLPTLVGVLVALAILVVSAGTTIFFLTQAPDHERLYKQGQHELANGQYAFAVKTLNKAISSKANDPKLFLALARAYIGIDQLDKAWESIDRAQQLGLGVVAEPELASDLANYYRQRNQYEKAANLLRPLAKARLPGKTGELSDLDALWGDECLRNGNLDNALRCWEEVHELKEGSRFQEADARLATIYQRIVSNALNSGDNEKALDCLAKINYIAQNPTNYELAASIYEGEEKFDLAIDQIRKAQRITPNDQKLSEKLASLLLANGKKLMSQGDSDGGFAYMQQAASLDSKVQVPPVALRNLSVGIDPAFRLPRLSAEAWNPTNAPINSLTVKADFWDKANGKSLWAKEIRLIDEFVAPLGSKESKPFEFVATQQTKPNGVFEFRIYLNGVLYDSYPIGKKASVHQSSLANSSTIDSVKSLTPPTQHSKVSQVESIKQASESTKTTSGETSATDLPNPGSPETASTSTTHSRIDQSPSSQNQVKPEETATPEEKTMKDLEF